MKLKTFWQRSEQISNNEMSFIKDVAQFWVETWRHNRVLFWIEAFGTITGIAAALTFSLNAAAPPVLPVLILLLLSDGSLACAMYIRRSSFMIVMMIVGVCTSLTGLSILLF